MIPITQPMKNMNAEVVYRQTSGFYTRTFGDYDIIMSYLRGDPVLAIRLKGSTDG